MNEQISVNLGNNREIVVRGETRYTGTSTPSSSMGGRNWQRYDCTIMGVQCEAIWDGDGRHNSEVDVPPQALVDLLLPIYERREEELRRERAEFLAR